MKDAHEIGDSASGLDGIEISMGWLRFLMIGVLLSLVVLKFIDRSWWFVLDRPLGYLTLAGLLAEVTVAMLLLLRLQRLAGLGLFFFGWSIVGLTPLLPSCKCLGPLLLSRSQRTVAGFVLGLLGAYLFLWAKRPQVRPES